MYYHIILTGFDVLTLFMVTNEQLQDDKTKYYYNTLEKLRSTLISL